MTHTIPYLTVNMLALSCFALMFATFLAAKKTQEIYAFMAVLAGCILWSGGAILMRLQMWPSMEFWYYVSIVSLFSLEWLFYLFVHNFSHQRGKFTLVLWTVLTIAIWPGTISGFFLAPPTPSVTESGTVFTYSTNWHILIPCVLFVAIIISTLQLLLRIIREQGIHSPGIRVIVVGGLVMLVGNLMQIGIPGNIFPYDALAGICFACLLMSALYKRRMFRMTLIISRSLLMIILVIICVLAGIYVITPLERFFKLTFGLPENSATTVVAIIFALILSLSYLLTKRLTDAIFTREEQQNKLLKRFTADATQTLDSSAIMAKLSDAIREEIPIEQVYICLAEGEHYQARYCSSPLASLSFSIARSSPQISYLREQEPYLIMSEFRSNPLYLSVWEEEKDLFRRLNIDCVFAMRDGKNIVGLILLTAADRDRRFSYVEISFLETICSVASIAMKNAGLYEQMFREARIDSLTNVFNYRYFMEKISEQFNACKGDCISLMFLDIDDFKLYNQLYGVMEGDAALRAVASTISRCTGEAGMVFRTSGKVFAVLLPHTDTRTAETMAREMQSRIAEINRDGKKKTITVSIGICAAPYAAATAKELRDNVDMAVYSAKCSGKNRVSVFRGTKSLPQRLTERTNAIVEQIEREDNDAYRNALAMISALTAAIDAKDHYTYDHSKNVAYYAAMLATAAGLNDEQVRMIYSAGLLHDIGKISVPEDILNKKGKLTEEEFRIMQSHVNNSIEMIRHLPEMDYLIPATLGHHERWDGKGYPMGIAGEQIPISARCLAVADVFDALTTDRPYRMGLPTEYALQQIEQGAGTQFDPELTRVFVDLVREKEIPVATRSKANG